MESEKGSLNRIKILYAIMFLFTGAFVFGMSFILGKSYEAILRNTVVSLIGAGTIIFMLLDAAGRGKEGFSPRPFRRSMFLLTPCFQTSGLQIRETISFCCLSLSVCGYFIIVAPAN